MAIEAPKVDLATTFADGRPIHLDSGHPTNATVTIHNSGNVLATGTVDLTLYSSGDSTLDDADSVLTHLPSRKIHIRPGKSVSIHVRLPATAGGVGGPGYVVAAASSSTNPADDDPANDIASAPVS